MTGAIYTDPYSDFEILMLDHSGLLLGVAYHPRISGTAVPWHGTCNHCRGGRQRGLTIHVKREIQMLRTQRRVGYVPSSECPILEYVVPSNDHSHTIKHWITADGTLKASISGKPDQPTLSVVKEPYEKILFDSKTQRCQSKIVHRCLRLLFTRRPASPGEIRACLSPLVEIQRSRVVRPGRRNPCDKIDWISIAARISQP